MSDTDKAHSLFSPSGAEARIACPGKLAMERGLPDYSSVYADEGTAAHTVAADCLTEGKHAIEYLGRVVEVKGGSASPVRTFTVDEEMAAYIQQYVDSIRTYAQGASYWAVETRVNFGKAIEQDEELSFGTSDVMILTDDGEELQQHDLKYGIGVKVHAPRNAQLLHYALGSYAMLYRLYPIKRVRLCIHQPRLNWLDEWSCTVEEMFAYAQTFKANAALVKRIYEQSFAWPAAELRKYLNPGEKQCMFCKAQAICPAASDKVTDLLAKHFTSFNSSTEPVTVESRIDLVKLGHSMDGVDFIEGWCRSVRAQVERQLLANKSPIGKMGPYKLVRGRKGNRRFSDEAKATAIVILSELTEEQAFEPRALKSPSKLEKICKPTRNREGYPYLWEELNKDNLIVQSDGQLSVAPCDDPRPAVKLKGDEELINQYFKPLTGEENV